MNRDDTSAGFRIDDRERVIRELLERGKPASPAHDEAVLAAAQRITEAKRRKGSADVLHVREARRRPRRWFVPLSLAAGIVMGASVMLSLQNGEPLPPSSQTRGAGEATVVPLNESSMAEAPTVFRWPAAPDAATYRVSLLDAAAEPLWTSEPTVTAEMRLPSEAIQRVSAAGTYIWIVEVSFGGQTRKLGPYWFKVVP